MNHPTDPPGLAEALATMDDTLARILAEPSWAQRLATATAAVLEQDAFIVMDGQLLNDAINTATEQVLAGLPDPVAGRVLTAVHDALPQAQPKQTAGEYALVLRTIAKGL